MDRYRISRLFKWMNERHSIYLRRKAGEEKPWTKDKIMQRYKFTNVFRELDRTTVWLRTHIRGPLKNDSLVFPATIIFRAFNRIETGRRLLNVERPINRFGLFTCWSSAIAEEVLRGHRPWVTGAYMTRSTDGMDKLTGTLDVIDRILERASAEQLLFHSHSIEGFTKELATYPCMGPFLAYEVASDLRHTYILDKAPDIMTWANPGPGAKRGLSRLLHNTVKPWARPDPKTAIGLMQRLLNVSKDYWRHPPRLEMRDIEHSLCEWDKYERTRKGEGRPRCKFNGGRDG